MEPINVLVTIVTILINGATEKGYTCETTIGDRADIAIVDCVKPSGNWKKYKIDAITREVLVANGLQF